MSVVPFNLENLRAAFATFSEAEPSLVTEKEHVRYLHMYLQELDVRTMVIEDPYVDHDFLEDFASYYVKCFHPYRRTCTRLHFFTSEFDQQVLDQRLEQGWTKHDKGPAIDETTYRGFVVVRPLPSAFMGRCILAQYPERNGLRVFPVGTPFHANLYGMPLSINTVPFAEQDTVTAACATNALWSALQVTGRLFQHRVPSPVEITSEATRNMPARSRVFPNVHGLTLEQMAQAIRSCGLEPYCLRAKDGQYVRQTARAYSSAGIPILMVFDLIKVSAEQDSDPHILGRHAAMISGYRWNDNTDSAHCTPANGTRLRLRSDNIRQLYVHDDQVGPFARMVFRDQRHGHLHLSTQWGARNGTESCLARPAALLVPLYNKIRIPAAMIMRDVTDLDFVLRGLGLMDESGAPLIEWDVKLQSVAQYRERVANCPLLEPTERRGELSRSLPRYLWTATGRLSDSPVIDLVFDATDIDAGRYLRGLFVHSPTLRKELEETARSGPPNLAQPLGRVRGKLNRSGP